MTRRVVFLGDANVLLQVGINLSFKSPGDAGNPTELLSSSDDPLVFVLILYLY